jgi:hypothetical protein
MNTLRITKTEPLVWRRARIWLCASLLAAAPWSTVHAAITWDADNGTRWWFDEVNWSTGDPEVNNVLPPSNSTGAGVTDTQINIGPGPWDLGEGVVYDPANDPNFANADDLTFPAGFGPQIINQLYISRATPQSNLLTIKGDLTVQANVIVGRSSGTRDLATNGRINQLSGKVTINNNVLDLGQTDTGANPPANGYGNGTYDYRGGTLEVGIPLGTGMRLSHGTASNAADGSPAGAGGHGRFIMHNPASGGYVRMSNISLASFPGVNDGMLTSADPNGVTKGVGILEFHYENGGTRPIQLDGNLSLNNGVDPTTMATRSARLDLRLNAPVTLSGNVPVNLGLVDVDFSPDDFAVGVVQGTGSLGGTFSSADGLTNYPEGSTVSATLGNTTYNWTISYHGQIDWADSLNSVVASVSPGVALVNKDVVLIGLSSQTIAVDDADFDGDNDVDGNDFLIWQRGLGTGNSNATGDADNDADVDANDLAIWKTQFGTGGSVVPAAASIPEPSAIVLALGLIYGVVRAKTMQRASRRPDPSNLLGVWAE